MKPVVDTNSQSFRHLNLTLSTNQGNISTTNVSMGGSARNFYQTTTANTTSLAKSPVINETTMSEMKAIFANSPNNMDSKTVNNSQTLLSNRRSLKSMMMNASSPRYPSSTQKKRYQQLTLNVFRQMVIDFNNENLLGKMLEIVNVCINLLIL